MPDWKNEEDYNFTEELSPEGWAWEFLRRNPEYRADYNRARKLESEFAEQYEECKPFHTGKAASIVDSSPLFFIYEPEKKETETENQWRSRCISGNNNPHRYRPSVGYGRKWRLAIPIQDHKLDMPPLFENPAITVDILNWNTISLYFKDDDDNYEQQDTSLVLVFNLELPVNKQLECAKKLFEKKFNKNKIKIKKGFSKKDLTKELKRYLRILDSDSGQDYVSNIELATILIPDTPNTYDTGNTASKSISHARKKAIKLRDVDYAKILLLNIQK